MYKYLISFALSSVMLALSFSANASDLPTPRAVPMPAQVYMPPPFTWTGFYLGGNFGGAWSSTTFTDLVTGVNLTSSRSVWLGGGQIGFNYQLGSFVLGAEGTFDWSSISNTSAPFAIVASSFQAVANTQWITTAAARFGIAADRALFYGKAGGGWVGNNATVTNLTSGALVSTSNTNSGWLLGAGVEYAFTPNWTAKLEYDYLRLRGWPASSPLVADSVNVKRQLSIVTAGINYKFGW